MSRDCDFYRPYLTKDLCIALEEALSFYINNSDDENVDAVIDFYANLKVKVEKETIISEMNKRAEQTPNISKRELLDQEPPEGFDSWEAALSYLSTPMES